MRGIAQGIAAIAAGAIACGAAGADAGAAMRVVDVPGVSGRSVTIAAAGRLADGGAIVAGTLTPRGRRRSRIVVVRLRHDGLIDSSFGDDGVVTAQLARGGGRSGSRATSVAVDPARGRSWIGAAIGGGDGGAVLALNGGGRRVRGFGSGGVVRFAGDATAPEAIAFAAGRLAVAATRSPCRGCRLLLLDASSGARRAQVALAPVAGGDAAACPQARLDSLAFAGADRLVLGGSGGSCPARLVVRDGALGPVADVDPGEQPQRIVVAAAAAPLDLCAGIERDGATRIVRFGAAAMPPARTWTPVAGTIAGVVPLGARACGALLRRQGGPARVLQASVGDASPSLTDVPAGLRAGAIFRCKRHVLVVGTRRRGGVDRASVAVTSVTRR